MHNIIFNNYLFKENVVDFNDNMNMNLNNQNIGNNLKIKISKNVENMIFLKNNTNSRSLRQRLFVFEDDHRNI